MMHRALGGFMLLLLVGGVNLWVDLARAASPEAVDGVTIGQARDHLDFRVGKKLVTTYHLGENVAKPYFWPLHTPQGLTVTRGWPMVKAEPGEQTDHIHQKSAWFCHGDILPEGMEIKQKIKGIKGVDFWSEAPGHGKIVCVAVEKPTSKGAEGHINTHNEWRTADGIKIMDETRKIGLHNLGKGYLLILDIDLYASVCPLTFEDTKEGSMGVRVRDSMTEKKGKGVLTNAEGKTGEKAIWGNLSAWCDYSGPVPQPSSSDPNHTATAGIAIFSDPANSSSACWHSRGYGLMAANPFGRNGSGFPAMKGKKDLVKLAKGDHLRLRYGILLHDGDAKQGKVAEAYAQFLKLRG